MGAKAALVTFGDVRAAVRGGGVPDRAAAEAVVRALRPGCAVEPVEDSDLGDEVHPQDGFAYVAVLPEATIVCDRELATVPVAERVLEFAEWAADGTLIRSHNAESHDQHELADAVALEVFGFTAVRQGPQRMAPDGSLVPVTESP